MNQLSITKEMALEFVVAIDIEDIKKYIHENSEKYREFLESEVGKNESVVQNIPLKRRYSKRCDHLKE